MMPAVASQLRTIYLTKGALATTAIEGNTLAAQVTSDDEILAFAEGQTTLPPSREYEKIEVDNILKTSNWLLQKVGEGNPLGLDYDTIKQLNFRVLVNTIDAEEDGVEPGQLRTDSRVVGNIYRCPHPEDCDYLLRSFCDWMSEMKLPDAPQLRVPYALLKAALAHLYIAWIHPFGNGNGRTARLVEHMLLLEAGVPDLSSQLFSNYYNSTRTLYYQHLDLASKKSAPQEFVEYAVRGFVEELTSQVSFIHAQNDALAWNSYVDGAVATIPQISGEIRERRRRLATYLPPNSETEISEIRLLHPTLAQAYAKHADDRAVKRDLKALEELGLVVRKNNKVRARRDVLNPFRPMTHEP